MTDYSERNAFIEALYDRWYDYICQQCYRFVNYEPIRSLLVEDCVQEAFIKAARHYAQLQSHPNAVGWIIKTSENQILNETRKLRVRRKTVSLDSGSPCLHLRKMKLKTGFQNRTRLILSLPFASCFPTGNRMFSTSFSSKNIL